jgi:hypothetical protein
MICLAPFDTNMALICALELAGLTRDGEHDSTIVDVFPVWPRHKIDGEWVDNVNVDPRWVANLALTECPQELKQYQEFPINPRRRFAGLVN